MLIAHAGKFPEVTPSAWVALDANRSDRKQEPPAARKLQAVLLKRVAESVPSLLRIVVFYRYTAGSHPLAFFKLNHSKSYSLKTFGRIQEVIAR